MKVLISLPVNSLFKKSDNSKKTFIKGPYCKINKAFECTNHDDISDFIYLKSLTTVFVDF